MDKQAQDERWNKLSQEEREGLMETYKRNPESCLFSTRYFGSHNLQPKPFTYEDVTEELFDGEDTFYISDIGSIVLAEGGRLIYDKYKLPNNCTSRKQAEKLLAINRLLNVARFLNGKDWKPDERDCKLWAIGIEKFSKVIMPVEIGAYDYRTEIVYFRTQDTVRQAIQILGEDTVRLALESNY